MTSHPLTGGCLCGMVRYSAAASTAKASFCHCRMCQRATGGPFAVWCSLATDTFSWTRSTPKIFRSSPIAERGFCADCGTPLLFRYLEIPARLSVTAGSLDHPEILAPSAHWGIEGHLPWVPLQQDLPRLRTEDDPEFQDLMRKALR